LLALRYRRTWMSIRLLTMVRITAMLAVTVALLGSGQAHAPLDSSEPTGAQISLAVRRVIVGPSPSADAVVGLAGGPGQAATPLTQDFARSMAPALKTRDLIVFDQRGTGGSDPLSCHALDTNGPPDQLAAMCALEIGAMRADFTTAASVSDIEALRRATGYARLVLYGTSYGTKVALEYAERYPQNVESLVLDSTVLVKGPDPLSLPSFAAIPTALKDLCSDQACAAISGDPVTQIAALVKRMAHRPLTGHVFTGAGRRVKAQMDPVDLFTLLVAGDLNPALRAELPAAVRSALHGDPASLLRLDALGEGLLPDQSDAAATPVSAFDQTLFVNTSCEEDPFPWIPRNAPEASRISQAQATVSALPDSAVFPFDRQTALEGGTIPICLGWPIASATPPVDAPLPDVPTLILSGEDDLRTPTSNARQVAAMIPDSELLVVPHTGHSVLGSDLSGCAARAVADFFASEPVKPCPRTPNQFAPTPIPPTALRLVARAPGVSGKRAARTLTVVRDTVVDLRSEIVGAILNSGQGLPPGASLGGLRGGDAALKSKNVVLKAFSYVRGVTLSGSIPLHLLADDKGRDARLKIGGASAAKGSVTLVEGGQAHGTLAGHRFSVALARISSASTNWPWLRVAQPAAQRVDASQLR
jgi:pimeloyl-ACP methyl ester carboxylesterase